MLSVTVEQSYCQAYHFSHLNTSDGYDIRTDMGEIICLHKVSAKKVQPTIFRKVFLNESLQPVDSVDYTIPGLANLIASESNEKYAIHVFHVKAEKTDFIQFVIAEKSGQVHTTFNKAEADFVPLFDSKVKKTNLVQLSFAENSGSPDILILRPRLSRGGYSVGGKIFALSAESGALLWSLPAPDLSRVISTNDRLLATSTTNMGGSSYQPAYTLHFIDKATGKILFSEPLYNGQGYRLISVFTSNGTELLVAGTEYKTGKEKSGHFFVSLFDLDGKRILDEVDTTARLSSTRMHALGHVFDREGNLFVIGEGWKADYTAAIATSAAGILSAALLGGAPYMNTQPDQRITSLVVARISTVDGKVKDFYTFPVGPWSQFSDMITDGSKVLIENYNQVLMYDPEQPNKAPSLFTSLRSGEGLIIGPFGPARVKPGKKTVGLEVLPVNQR